MTATEIGQQLAQRAEDVARHLLPGGERQGNEWVAGSTGGESGQSLKVVLSGPKAGMWIDFAGAEHEKGDLIGLWKASRNCDLVTACTEAEQFLGNSTPIRRVLKSWEECLRRGSIEELEQLAAMRKIPGIAGLQLASDRNILFFGQVWDSGANHEAWIITDDSRRNAQARKMNGELWRFDEKKKPAKAKTIYGTEAKFPVGLHGINGESSILLTEGGPDLLCAFHLIATQNLQDKVRPVGMFGSNQPILPEIAPEFAGRHVKIAAHNDDAGTKAFNQWAAQLPGAFVSRLLLPAKDLNDCISAGLPIPPIISRDDPESRRITLKSCPVEPVTRLFLNNKPVATPGNLVTLISKAKTGKTATTGAVVAAIIRAHFDKPDPQQTFKFSSPHTKEAVVLIDTEQSPFDAFTCHQRMFARAGHDADLDWFHHHALVGYSAAQLRASLPGILAKAKAQQGGIFLLILDGVADFVASVNDEAECNEFISWLRSIAVSNDCPIICVIHSNEAQKAGDDGRGHLGKQLTRKAESNLLLRKTGEVTVLTSEKQRKAPITVDDGIAFAWSQEHGRHMLTEAIPADVKSRPGRKPVYDHQKCLQCVPGKDQQPQTLEVIRKDIAEIPCKMDIRTLKDLMEKWVSTGEVESIPHKTLGRVFKRAY